MGLFREVGNFLNNITGVSSSAKQQQQAQTQLQNNAQGFNAEEAQKERDWQTAMSNTEHQRAVADMQKAGINPILAAGAGADVSGGASASVNPGEATTGASGGNPLSMFLNTIATAKNIDKINADITNQTNLTNAEVARLVAETENIGVNTENAKTKTPQMKNDENFAKTWWGRNISPALRDIFGGGGGAVAAGATAGVAGAKMTSAKKNAQKPIINIHKH